MREIFGHVTAVIRRIAHACVATWRRVMLHGSLVSQSTDHTLIIIFLLVVHGLAVTASSAVDKRVRPCGAVCVLLSSSPAANIGQYCTCQRSV